MTAIETDLNSVISSAVNARIEAALVGALSGDEVIGRYVTAALTQPIEVGSSYNKRKTTFIKHTLDAAMQDIAKAAVARVLTEEVGEIEAAVRKELRANISAIAQQLVGSVTKAAESPYGITVELKYPSR